MLMPLISTVMNAKADGGKRAAGFSEAQFQIAGHGVRLGDVVERHHHQAEEQHRGDRADPIPVRRQNAVLIGRRRPAHQFERAEIGRQKAEARDPGGHLPPGQEEIFAGVGLALQVETDGQHQQQNKKR